MSDDTGLRPGSILGEAAKPPFAVLPDPAALFLNRTQRLAALAPAHDLAPYLGFLATLTRAQHDIEADLAPAALPPFERIGQALAGGMAPLAKAQLGPDPVIELTLERFLDRLADAEAPPEAASAIHALRSMASDDRRRLIAVVLGDERPAHDVAGQALVTAALQVHFARLAALLTAADLQPIADSACPVCCSAPVTCSIVGWPRAHNTRFCTCSLCATMWNVVRVKCLWCGSTDGLSYQLIEGKPDTIKAESCEKCRSYIKVLYQVSDHSLDPVADDVATLGLDILMAQGGWQRRGHNPFLFGY
ncbi:MAG TPA: formate dehydrogenase accessory protein FdhE [Hyphomicrobiaceae bacterium]|nr:formate dehydrogenase accessory protein FdhE [Hyphomicrobiaceae bacterium]